MFTTAELQEFTKTKNIIFYKPGCPYCAATQKLFNTLKNDGLLSSYDVVYLGDDFSNEQLTEICTSYGWTGSRAVPSKPQIFINERGNTEYFAGNDYFYNSAWNLGDDRNGNITINEKEYNTPQEYNPMG